jgi:NAD(P)-dependent dehydrogenase (short-subunit alcohol dehydrogenase family)
MRFAKKVALVTGGTGGLGKAVTLALLAEGAHVVVTFIYPEEFAALREAAGARAEEIEGQYIDVTDEAAARKLVGEIVNEHGHLDVQ